MHGHWIVVSLPFAGHGSFPKARKAAKNPKLGLKAQIPDLTRTLTTIPLDPWFPDLKYPTCPNQEVTALAPAILDSWEDGFLDCSEFEGA